MADVATLGLRVTQEGVAQATQNLNNLAAAGDKAEASTKKLGTTTGTLTRFQQDLVNRAREVFQAAELLDVQNKKAVQQWEKQRDMWAQIAARHKQTAVVENELAAATQLVIKNQQAAADYTRRLDEEQKRLNETMGRSTPGINSIRSSLTSMTSSALGAIPGVTQLSGVLGTMALGSNIAVGVLAAIAAISLAYKAMTEDAKKAAEQQKRLTDSLLEWYRTKQAGGQGAQEIDATTKAMAQQQGEIDKLTKKLADLKSTYNAKTGLRDEGAIAATTSQIAKLTQAIEEQRKAIAAKQTDDAQSIASSALELEKQRALNDAFGKGAVALARINAEYDLRGKLLQNAAQYTGAELASMNAIARATADEQIRNAVLVEQKREMDELDKSQTKTLEDLRAALEKTNVEWTINAKLYERIIELNKELNGAKENGYGVNVGGNAKKMADDIDKAAEAIKKAEQYSKDLETIWRNGIGKIVTDGTKSYHDFFEDVLQLFSQLMQKMEDEAKRLGKSLEDLGGKYKALGIGAAAITGGLAGYSVGSSTGSAAAGVGAGALTGAMSGAAFGAPGVIIGGLAGVVGGLMGAAKAHQEAAKQLREAADAIRSKAASYIAKAGGDDVQSRLLADTQEYTAIMKELGAVYDKGGMSMRDFTTQTAALTAAHEALAEAIKHEAEMVKARDMLDLQGQILDAKGDTAGAAELRRMMQMWEAINSGKSPEYLALLQTLQDIQRANEATAKAEQDRADAEQKAAEEAQKQKELLTQLRDATQAMADDVQRQIDAQEQTIQATQRVVDSLKQFRDSLSLNPSLSILSPIDQLAQAKSAFQSLVSQAMQGDATAASGLPDAAQQFLELSRNVNASGAGYISDFRTVQAALGAVEDQFGAQLTTEQLMLKELQKQNAALQRQIDLLNQQLGVQKQSAARDYVQANLDISNSTGATLDQRNAALSRVMQMFPGLVIQPDKYGNNVLTNDDYRSALDYWKWVYSPGFDLSKPIDPNQDIDPRARQVFHDAGLPGFAMGGFHGGGFRVVGERGPELEATGPSRITNAQQLNAPTVAELRELRADVNALGAILRAGFTKQIDATEKVAAHTGRTARVTQRQTDAIQAGR